MIMTLNSSSYSSNSAQSQGVPSSFSDRLNDTLAQQSTVSQIGKVVEAVGTILRATGLSVRIGELCLIKPPHGNLIIPAEVVGFSNGLTLLTPLGSIQGVSTGSQVVPTGSPHEIPVGKGLLGRVIDANGRPIDDCGPINADKTLSVYAEPPNPLKRMLINTPFSTGVRAIDGLLTVGRGQRLGIFAVAGGGKSTLLGMIARGSNANINVVALVGERGREVREFIVDNLGEAGMAKSVIVVATSDRPAMERAKCAYVATAIAEYFRDEGSEVLLMVDSVTRYARALRDVGLAIGEPPTRRGFTPSVFSAMPRLFERAGTSERSTITAFYTVLAEDEDGNDPIAEEVRSILDGHIVLSRKLAAAHHYPAIDIAASTSRTMSRVTDKTHKTAAAKFRALQAKYEEVEMLIRLGEYKPGSDAQADLAINRIEGIRIFLQQSTEEKISFPMSRNALIELTQ